MSINKPGALGQVNVFLACVEIYTYARFSRGTAQVLARIDCDRGYNPRHVPVVQLWSIYIMDIDTQEAECLGIWNETEGHYDVYVNNPDYRREP
jgi:hypothetical protein